MDILSKIRNLNILKKNIFKDWTFLRVNNFKKFENVQIWWFLEVEEIFKMDILEIWIFKNLNNFWEWKFSKFKFE
jgi:hypothetical protein